MFGFAGKNNALKTPAKPAPASLEAQGKKKELDEIAVETLRRVIDNVDNRLELDGLDSSQKKQFDARIHETLGLLLEEGGRYLSQGDKHKVVQYVLDEIFGYGPITPLLQDPEVTEIMVNGYANVYAERGGKIRKTEIAFRDNDHVLHAINKIITPLGRRIDESSPTVDARLPDGSRVNAIIPPLALRGPSLTIRKFAADPLTAEDLIKFGTMSEEMALFLAACVRSRVNIVVSGGTGSGKTTTLNMLSSFIPENERIVTIEDTAELQLQQDHLVTLESRPANIEGKGQFTIRELVVNSLRMRPDRIIIGEVRGGEALDMLQAMNTGHDGSISTLHANSPRDALARLETMVLMAGMELPLRAIREQVGAAIELIVQQDRFSDGSRKITRVSAVERMQNESLVIEDIFVFEQAGIDENGHVSGEHRATGKLPRCLGKLKARGESFVPGIGGSRGTEKGILPAGGRKIGFLADITAPTPSAEREQGDASPGEEKRPSFALNRPGEVWTASPKEEGSFLAAAAGEKELVYSREESGRSSLPAAGERDFTACRGESGLSIAATAEAAEDWPAAGAERSVFGEEETGRKIRGIRNRFSVVGEEKTGRVVDETGGKGAGPAGAPPGAVSPREEKGARGLAAFIPPGRRGIALTVHESNGLYGYLQPGDRVDVLAVYQEQAVHEQRTARTAAQNAIVLDIRENSSKNSGEGERATFCIILAVNPVQAEALAYAGFKGSFYLTLCPDET